MKDFGRDETIEELQRQIEQHKIKLKLLNERRVKLMLQRDVARLLSITGRFARHRRLSGVHDRVRHRRDGGGLRRHRQCARGIAAPDIGDDILVQTFVVVVIGGVGSFPGAILGGLIAGEIISITSMFNPGYAYVMLFAAMAWFWCAPLRPARQRGRE